MFKYAWLFIMLTALPSILAMEQKHGDRKNRFGLIIDPQATPNPLRKILQVPPAPISLNKVVTWSNEHAGEKRQSPTKAEHFHVQKKCLERDGLLRVVIAGKSYPIVRHYNSQQVPLIHTYNEVVRYLAKSR